MKRILITGFDPFGGERINPSYEAVKNLKDEIDGALIIKKEIPTEFYKSKDVMLELINEYNPDVVINVGQAGGREGISLEKQAFNLMDASIPDNSGFKPENLKIKEDKEEVLLSTLPIDKMLSSLKKKGIKASISESAGRFVCNYIMYSMLDELRYKNIISGFIHVPYSKEQVLSKIEGTPFMEIEEMTKALELIIESIIK